MPEDAGYCLEGQSHVSTCLTPPRKLALLKEWHASLTAIVARDPEAHETLKTLADIERQIEELNSKKNTRPREPQPATVVY